MEFWKPYRSRMRKRNTGETITIGVMGAGKGCGVTHFSILFANYLAAAEIEKTAVLEWNNHCALEDMVKVCTGMTPKRKPVSILDVDYFFRGGADELEFCLQKGYGAVVLDLGSMEDGRTAEFLQCRMQCFIGALNEWKLTEWLSRKEWMLKGKDSWNFLMVFGSEIARREINRRFGLAVQVIPYSPDVFSINPDMAKFLSRIWRKKME